MPRDLKALFAITALGLLGWLMLTLFVVFEMGAETHKYPCTLVHDSRGKEYLTCVIKDGE